MDRKNFLKNVAGSGLGLVGLGNLNISSLASQSSPSNLNRKKGQINSDDRPNIIVIMADDMGFSDIGCYGGEIDTPNIDRLANNGLRYTKFYNAARCCPSRASLMTGLYPHEAGVGHMLRDLNVPGYRDKLSDNSVTIPEVLNKVGYRTMMSGKWHLGWREEGSPTARGFQRFYGTRGFVDSYFTIVPRTEVYLDDTMVMSVTENPVHHLHPGQEWYTTDAYTDYAIKFIDEAIQHDSPFFLYLAHNAPHFPLHAKKEDLKKYRGRYREGFGKSRKERYQRLIEMGIIEDHWDNSPQDSPEWDTLTAEEQDELDLKMALYAAIIDRMDQSIGRLIDKLETEDQLDNTLILFFSDNGGTSEIGLFGINDENTKVHNYEEWARVGGWSSSYGQGWANVSNTPFRMYKKFSHEGGISTPLIAHWPDRIKQGGALRHQMGHVVDIMATCLELSGAEYPGIVNGNEIKPHRGKSLVPTFDNEGNGHQRLYWEHEGNCAIRDGKWKLVSKYGEPWSLYNIKEDRTELHNIINKNPNIARNLRSAYERWAKNCNVLPYEEVQRLRQAT